MSKTIVFQLFNFMLWVALDVGLTFLLPGAEPIALAVGAAIAALVITTAIMYWEYKHWEANHRKKWERIAKEGWRG